MKVWAVIFLSHAWAIIFLKHLHNSKPTGNQVRLEKPHEPLMYSTYGDVGQRDIKTVGGMRAFYHRYKTGDCQALTGDGLLNLPFGFLGFGLQKRI
jgi:hypothetical protein